MVLASRGYFVNRFASLSLKQALVSIRFATQPKSLVFGFQCNYAGHFVGFFQSIFGSNRTFRELSRLIKSFLRFFILSPLHIYIAQAGIHFSGEWLNRNSLFIFHDGEIHISFLLMTSSEEVGNIIIDSSSGDGRTTKLNARILSDNQFHPRFWNAA